MSHSQVQENIHCPRLSVSFPPPQRLREQIRAWLLAPETKDIEGLPEARRAIEVDMVRNQLCTSVYTSVSHESTFVKYLGLISVGVAVLETYC